MITVSDGLKPSAVVEKVVPQVGSSYYHASVCDDVELHNGQSLHTKEQLQSLLNDPEKSPRGQLWYACERPTCGFGEFPNRYDGEEGYDCPEDGCEGEVVRTRLIVENDLRRRLGVSAEKAEGDSTER